MYKSTEIISHFWNHSKTKRWINLIFILQLSFVIDSSNQNPIFDPFDNKSVEKYEEDYAAAAVFWENNDAAQVQNDLVRKNEAADLFQTQHALKLKRFYRAADIENVSTTTSTPITTTTSRPRRLSFRGVLRELSDLNNEMMIANIRGDQNKVKELSDRMNKLRAEQENQQREYNEQQRRRNENQRRQSYQYNYRTTESPAVSRQKSNQKALSIFGVILGIIVFVTCCVAGMSAASQADEAQTSLTSTPVTATSNQLHTGRTVNNSDIGSNSRSHATYSGSGPNFRTYTIVSDNNVRTGPNASSNYTPLRHSPTASPWSSPNPARNTPFNNISNSNSTTENSSSSTSPSAPPPPYEEAIHNSRRPSYDDDMPPPFNPNFSS